MSIYRDNSARELRVAIEPDRRARDRMLTFVAGAGAALGMSALVSIAREPSAAHSVPVDVLMTSPRTGVLRVEGDLVVGSMVSSGACDHRFDVEKSGFRMPVRYTGCVLSDPFEAALRDGTPAPMMLEGELQPSGFVATSAAARVPSCFSRRSHTPGGGAQALD